MTGIRSATIISAAPSPPSPFSTARIPDDHDRMQSCTRTATVMGVMPEDCTTCRYCNQGHPTFRRHGCHTLSCVLSSTLESGRRTAPQHHTQFEGAEDVCLPML
jgi:hypothetical protein